MICTDSVHNFCPNPHDWSPRHRQSLGLLLQIHRGPSYRLSPVAPAIICARVRRLQEVPRSHVMLLMNAPDRNSYLHISLRPDGRVELHPDLIKAFLEKKPGFEVLEPFVTGEQSKASR